MDDWGFSLAAAVVGISSAAMAALTVRRSKLSTFKDETGGEVNTHTVNHYATTIIIKVGDDLDSEDVTRLVEEISTKLAGTSVPPVTSVNQESTDGEGTTSQ